MSMRVSVSAAVLAALASVSATAQDTLELKITTVSVPSDLHTQSLHVFADRLNEFMPDRFDIQIYDSGSLFGQGGDLDALQRGNAEMTYVSFQLIADAIPEFSIFTAGYLFRSPEHLRAVLDSGIGTEFRERVSDDMGIQILDACYLGTRELNLRRQRNVQVPEDLAGVKLRMPSAESWLFLGSALGANPTPLPFGETYLALQTGTVDAQDNPLPTIEAAKFYEVTEQIVLTDHLVDSLPLAVNNQTWDQLSDDEKAAMTRAAQDSCAWNNMRRATEEQRLLDFFREKGLEITRPDVDAFREHVQAVYLASDKAELWPEGWLDEINTFAPY